MKTDIKKIIFIFLVIAGLISCGNSNQENKLKNTPPKFSISLPDSFIKESNKFDKYNLLTATKYVDNEICSMIEIRYSNDPSFSEISNEELITEMINTTKFDSAASHMFNNFKVHSKQELNLKGVGKCFSCIYSGNAYSNGIRITNFTIQFIKNNIMYTLIGSSTPDLFSGNHKEFIEIFDTFEI